MQLCAWTWLLLKTSATPRAAKLSTALAFGPRGKMISRLRVLGPVDSLHAYSLYTILISSCISDV